MKYPREQLKQMAATFLGAHSSGDPPARVLLNHLMQRTGLSESQCLLNIIMLA